MAANVKRGDIVIVSSPGDYGKPRPAVIVQSDALRGGDSVLVSLFTSEMTQAAHYRLTVEPDNENGLVVLSQIMVDKIIALPRTKCSPPVGALNRVAIVALNQMLAVMMGIAD